MSAFETIVEQAREIRQLRKSNELLRRMLVRRDKRIARLYQALAERRRP